MLTVCEFHFNSKQIRVSLGIGRKTYLQGSIPLMFEFKSVEKKNERKPRNPVDTEHKFERT